MRGAENTLSELEKFVQTKMHGGLGFKVLEYFNGVDSKAGMANHARREHTAAPSV